MARPKKAASNFECQIKDKSGKKCGAVLGSPQAFHAHIHHSMHYGHGQRKPGFQVTDAMHKMTKKSAQPSTYNPAWGKEGKPLKKQAAKLKAAKAKPTTVTLQFPIILEVDCDFSNIRIGGEEITPQTISIK